MVKSNRAAALRWLAAHAGQTLDTLAYENGELCWAPGPRRLEKAPKGSAGYVMVREDGSRSYMSTDQNGSEYYPAGDTLVIRSMVHMVSGPNGVTEIYRETHYSVATPAPFVYYETSGVRLNEPIIEAATDESDDERLIRKYDSN